MSSFLEKRLQREIAARKAAEKILEEKSRELYLKNQELAEVNAKLNHLLEVKSSKLAETEEERFTLFENSAMGIALTLHGSILKVNDTFAQMLGYTVNEVIGKTIADVSFKDDAVPSMQNTKRLQNGEIDSFTMQKRYRRKNNTYFWANTHVSAVRDTKGRIKYHLAIIENIHERKIAERKTQILVKQLRDINSRLENYAHVVSHDLKAPITGINTVLTWLEEMEVSQQARKLHDLIKGRATKMYNLIDEVMAYSKVNKEQETRKLVDIEEVIDSCIQFLHIPHHMEIRRKGIFPIIFANRTKVQQVFRNIIDNAIKYNDKDKGLIEIIGEDDDDYWVFKIKDNGMGIESKYYSKIFAIFETINRDTKTASNTTQTSNIQQDNQQNKGTGIGLNLVKQIINQYKGSITVASQVGVYTEFTFSFLKSETSPYHEHNY